MKSLLLLLFQIAQEVLMDDLRLQKSAKEEKMMSNFSTKERSKNVFVFLTALFRMISEKEPLFDHLSERRLRKKKRKTFSLLFLSLKLFCKTPPLSTSSVIFFPTFLWGNFPWTILFFLQYFFNMP